MRDKDFAIAAVLQLAGDLSRTLVGAGVQSDASLSSVACNDRHVGPERG
jgi:hypothetical protein